MRTETTPLNDSNYGQMISLPAISNYQVQNLASYPVSFRGGKEKSLVSTVCACARFVREFAMNITSKMLV